jgi:hypothetical protein
MCYGLDGRGSPRAKSLKLAERLPTIPTGNGRRRVIVRAVAYLHARLSFIFRRVLSSVGAPKRLHSDHSRLSLVDCMPDFL